MNPYHLPTRPYDVIAAVNRRAAATGSPRYAALAHGANYNGHAVSVYFNGYRGYWLAEYTWAGRQVLARGSLTVALAAAKEEYDRGALGASVVVSYPKRAPSELHTPSETPEAFEAACIAAGYSPGLDGDRSWWTPLHDEVSDAMWHEQQLGAPAVGFLCNSKTVEEYKQKLDAFFAERRAARSASR